FINPIAASFMEPAVQNAPQISVKADQFELEKERTRLHPLEELVQEVLDELKPRTHGIQIWVELTEKSGWYCDRNEIRIVLLSLVGRAIESVPPMNGHICIRCQPEGQAHTRLDIIDNGRGLPPEQLSSIFRPGKRFAQGPNGESIAQQSLFSVRNIIELHGGAISAESFLGEGTTFSVTLESALPAELVA
ncbi:MAG: ATP-binding protein, partial [Verrucomicrobiota bacterium]